MINKTGRRKLSLVLKILFAMGLLYFLARKGLLDMEAVAELMRPSYFIFGAFLVGCNVFITGVRWGALLMGQGLKTPWAEILKLHLIGIFFNFALPGSVSGDVVKGYYLVKRHPGKRLLAGTTVIMDRVIGLYAMLFVAVLGLLSSWSILSQNPYLASLAVAVGLSFLGFSVALGIALSQRLGSWLSLEKVLSWLPGGASLGRIYVTFQSYRRRPRVLLTTFALSLVAQGFSLCLFYFVSWALGESMSWSAFFFAVPLGLVVTALPIAPAGVGVGQAAMVALFNSYLGASIQTGPVGMTVFQVLLLAWSLLGAVFYLRRDSGNLTQVVRAST